MARKKPNQDTRDWSVDFADNGKEIVDLSDEIKNSMREYIDFTLTSRALPYIDGLKPVHKAILWGMWTTGCRADGIAHKSASVSGNVIGSLWPHSGEAAYLASAGMTRTKADDTRCGACKLNLSLINGHGNFGASFEDGPASQRYTEQKLSKNGEACVRDAENGAVFMEPSFDAKHTLPELAPVEIPLLLINGSDGLAYGYNVSWLPHNPSEAIKSVIKRIDKPNCSVNDIMKIMPGPDFPSGGIIIDHDDGIKHAYETGMGTLTLTSRYTIMELPRGRHAIDFYETPYGVSRSGDKSIVSGITSLAQNNPSYGITSVKNLSGGDNDCLIEVIVKSGVSAQSVADALISSTSCMLTQNMSYRQSAIIGDFERTEAPDATKRTGMIRLCHQKPCDLGVLEYIDAFIDFRRSCVINSYEYERTQLQAKKHLIDGLLKALIDIDEVIHVIRHSANKDTARKNLKKAFKIDDLQADYVLAIPLSRLTRSDKISLESNSKNMQVRIGEIDEILSSDESVKAEIRRQLKEVLKLQSLPRRTSIVRGHGDIVLAKADNGDESRIQQAYKSYCRICNEDIDSDRMFDDDDAGKASDGGLGLSSSIGALKVSGTTTLYLSSNGMVCQSKKKVKDDYIRDFPNVDVNSIILLVFDDASSVRIPAYELPTRMTLMQKPCVGIVPLGTSKEFNANQPLVGLVVDSGRVKILDTSTLTKSDCDVMNLKAGERLMHAGIVNDSTQFVLVTDDARVLTFKTSTVNKQGRSSAGVAGMKIGDARMVYGGIVEADNENVLVTSTPESSKATLLKDYPMKGRGTSGVRCQKLLKGEHLLSFASVVSKRATLRGNDSNEVVVPIGKRDASGTTKLEVQSYVLS